MASPDQPRFGSSSGEQELLQAEVTKQANRLINEFRQALRQSPSFLQAAGKCLLDDPKTSPSMIDFTQGGIPYRFYIYPDDGGRRLMVANKGEEGEGGESFQLHCAMEGYGSLEPWGLIMYNDGKGEAGSRYPANSQKTIERVEEFLREFQSTS